MVVLEQHDLPCVCRVGLLFRTARFGPNCRDAKETNRIEDQLFGHPQTKTGAEEITRLYSDGQRHEQLLAAKEPERVSHMAWQTLGYTHDWIGSRCGTRLELENCSWLPGNEFVVAVIQLFTPAPLTRRNFQNFPKNPLANLFDRGFASDNSTAIEIHVIEHPFKHRSVSREFDARNRLVSSR